ncbi:MAG: valine--tRNA ligase [Acidobacteria bacterium]|nr:MAG: valine--tRNA ligase [Acidobacteriota bacterium]
MSAPPDLDVESRWYPVWEKAGYFVADPASGKPRFSIVIPPPNVTGSLHIGHAFTLTLQDVTVRWKRMSGFDTLWLPGLDHAGIATQMVVERQLAKEGKKKEDLGREAFEARVWKWKEESGGRILNQLRIMGYSLDWTRERFTMDPGMSRAVREVFVQLWEQGLIYRGYYIVNWCPRCVTALSDLEVETETEPGQLWHIRYPEKDGGPGIVVATTRPETLLGDTAVAVHPDDERHRRLIGRPVLLPVLGREIPVVADTFVDREFGTGAVKITPAHDPNDFLAAQRLGLPAINIMDERAVLNENAGPYAGQDRFEARKGIVAQLEREGLLVKTEPYQVPLGRCQRCGTIVEPRLSRQWFVKMQPLAEPAIAAAEDGRIGFVPESWTKTYFEWMRNIRDWCISRQLWWGHRIPAWTCAKCDELVVAREAPASCPKCGGGELVQETDVLDTWFSSGLFPFSTLGWPDKTVDLQRYYPSDVMMTGYDILFFWVARMIVLGMRFAGGVPFPVVFLNGLVRDEHGDKMSKTKGNDVDPLELVARHGTDAVRFTMTALGAPGTNPALSEQRLAGHRAFINKLWNASRFLLMNLEGERAPSYVFEELPLPSRWILSRQQELARKVREALTEFRFDQAASELYHFVWDEFCDWYIEIAKSYFPDPVEGPRTRAVLLEVLEKTLRMLHPVIPYVTEEIWQRLPHEGESIMVAPYPQPEADKYDVEDEAAMGRVMRLVTAIRTLRATYEVDRKRRIDVTVVAPQEKDSTFITAHGALVRHLAGLGEFLVVAHAPDTQPTSPLGAAAPGFLREAVDGVELRVAMAGLFDVAAEKARLTKELGKIEGEMASLKGKLDNPQFVERAKPEVVSQARHRVEELTEKKAKVAATLRELDRAS